MNQLVVKDKDAHKFKKGVSGNPNGRPKGSKNAITLAKFAIEGALRTEMKGEMSAILKEGIRQAKAGDKDMIRYFLDKWITPAKASADEDAPREKVQILIGRLDADTPVKGRIIEGSATDGNQISQGARPVEQTEAGWRSRSGRQDQFRRTSFRVWHEAYDRYEFLPR